MNILVTGGAGYIGSHAVHFLVEAGHHVIVLDNLSTGHRHSVPHNVPFYEGSVGNAELVMTIVSRHKIESVIHFAASIEVAESIAKPSEYYENNFSQTLFFLQVLMAAKIRKFVFSSTATVYGVPTTKLLDEDHPKNPISPYGQSKLMVEMLLKDFSKAYGLGYAVLRYFNVAGAHPLALIGEDHRPETHLIPRLLIAALNSNITVPVHGNDYPTEDGTCIRDYVHVQDIVSAHELALRNIQDGMGSTYNVGSENGYSVLEVIEACQKITRNKIKIDFRPRRPGDSPILVASSHKIKTELGWQPQYPDLNTMITHAWNWHQRHPLDSK